MENNNIIMPNNLFSNSSNYYTISLNGQVTTTPSFYAPIVAGGSGMILTSRGPNLAPVWTEAPQIASNANSGLVKVNSASYRSNEAGTRYAVHIDEAGYLYVMI